MGIKKTFTKAEVETIRDLLRRKSRAGRTEQKSIRSQIRRIGFKISDYDTSGRGFTVKDFDLLVKRGYITIMNNIESSDKPKTKPVISEHPPAQPQTRVKLSHEISTREKTIKCDFETARHRYRPEVIKCLFIAESPPEIGSCRFFYFENVYEGDSLFIEMMKVLYLGENPHIPSVRLRKREYLRRFQEDGFYLIDSVEEPIGVRDTSRKVRRIKEELPSLRDKVDEIVDRETPIILISRPVFDAVAVFLRTDGFNIINEEMIDFPGSGGQKRFREKLGRLLDKLSRRTS